jgi:hypothetical protein
MKRSNQKGAALLLALIFVLVLSVMTASIMFLSQSETWSSLNYRLMTQSRYGAEAGLHATANYITNPGGAGYPGIGASDPITAYNTNVSPVTYNASPVVLSSLSGVSANYPVAAVKTAFSTNVNNSLSTGNNSVNYTASATLLTMKQFPQCGSAQPLTAQLWKITSHGDMGGLRNAEVEVSAFLESHIVSCYQYAAYATSSGCGAISWSGGGPINSYDSSTVTLGVAPTPQAYDGNIGSNGNANTAPHTIITGTFSSPETGVGACSGGAACTGTCVANGCETSPTSCAAVTPAIVQLPQSVTYPTPVTAYPAGVVESSLTAPGGTLTPNNCGPGLTAGCYGDISSSITLQPYVNPVTNVCSTATYYINTISMNGGQTLTVGACPAGSTPAGSYQPVIVNIVDVNHSTTPVSIGGGSVANPSYNPANLQIQYAGTGNIKIHGGTAASAVLYAPNAPVELDGANSDWYGSLIASTLTLNGNGASVHYDRRLANNLNTLGNWTMDTFTWNKY